MRSIGMDVHRSFAQVAVFESGQITQSFRIGNAPILMGLRPCSLRGRVGGSGLRFGFCLGSGSGASSGGAIRAAAVSLYRAGFAGGSNS